MKRTVTTGFNFAAIFVALFAFGLGVNAQSSTKFTDVVITYKSVQVTPPATESQYQDTLKQEASRLETAKLTVQDIYTADTGSLAGKKQACGSSQRCLAYLNDADKQLENDRTQALENLNAAFEQRKGQLDAVRRGFGKTGPNKKPETEPKGKSKPVS